MLLHVSDHEPDNLCALDEHPVTVMPGLSEALIHKLMEELLPHQEGLLAATDTPMPSVAGATTASTSTGANP